MNELAPKSNRSSLVNLGNVTGNKRKRVARISKICNSVKLETIDFYYRQQTKNKSTVRNCPEEILIMYH